MIPPPIPLDEDARIAALEDSGWKSVKVDAAFTHWLEEVAAELNFPMLSVSVVDRRQQIPVASVGFRAKPCSREASLDGHVILDHEPLIVTDALKDERFADNPLVHGPPFIRFYVGTPLITKSGKMAGALAGADTQPGRFPEAFYPQLEHAAAEAARRLDRCLLVPAVNEPAPSQPAYSEPVDERTLIEILPGGPVRDRLFFEEFLDQYSRESQRILHTLRSSSVPSNSRRALEDLRELSQHMEFDALVSLCRALELDVTSRSGLCRVSMESLQHALDAAMQAVQNLHQEASSSGKQLNEVSA